MSGWGWAAMIFIGWMVVSLVTAPLVGRWLRRNSEYYPTPEQLGLPPEHPGLPEHPEWPEHWEGLCAQQPPEDADSSDTAVSGRE